MAYNFNALKAKVGEVEAWLARELATIRTGRATPALLDSIQVESYGARVPLKQLGSITVEDPRTLRLTFWDKTQLKGVESAIAQANLGVSVTADSDSLRVIFPELTSEKRALLTKLLKEKVEQARISLRQERDRVWHDIQAQEREGQISEDLKFRAKDELQKIIDEGNAKLGAAGERKEAEVSK